MPPGLVFFFGCLDNAFYRTYASLSQGLLRSPSLSRAGAFWIRHRGRKARGKSTVAYFSSCCLSAKSDSSVSPISSFTLAAVARFLSAQAMRAIPSIVLMCSEATRGAMNQIALIMAPCLLCPFRVPPALRQRSAGRSLTEGRWGFRQCGPPASCRRDGDTRAAAPG